jgi:hypothetical protein
MTITAFESSPDGGKGLARDTHVRWARGAGRWALGAGRWALEEVGQPYEVRLVSFRAMKEPVLALHPFGQFRPTKKAISACSKRGRSCSSRRATRGAKVWKKKL